MALQSVVVPSPAPQKPGNRFVSTVFAFVLVAAVLLAGVWIGGHPRQTGLDRLPNAVLDRLVSDDRTATGTEVLAILEMNYYKPIDAKTVQSLQDASAKALVEALGDPYTQYLSKDDYAAFLDQRAGTYVGVGIEWHPEGDLGRIIRVVPGGPAAKAGIRAKDGITAVDGVRVLQKDEWKAMQTVRGEEGTSVTLRVVRGKEKPRDVTMKRAQISERVVESRVETIDGRRVGYVRLDRFTTGSAKALRSALTSLNGQRITGVVFDLRGDPGGLVDEAVDVVSAFVPEGSTVATTKSRSGASETLTTDDDPVVGIKLPVVILVDGNSASASEIVAGALRDAGRAQLVGATTFGKALIQTTRSLSDGGAIKYTTATYLTPKGFDLGTRGLTPDVAVKDDPKTPADEVLQRGLAGVGAN